MNRDAKRLVSVLIVITIAFLSLACSSDAQQDEWIYSWEVIFSDGESHSWQKEVEVSTIKETPKELDFEGNWQEAEDHTTKVAFSTIRADTSSDHYKGKRLIFTRHDGIRFSIERVMLKKSQAGCYLGRLLRTKQLVLIRIFREGVECANEN